jgi:hypothetical protein
MPTRVVVVHDDRAFLDPLKAALRDSGYDVQAVDDPTFKAGPPHASDKLEIAVSRSAGAYPGLRIRVTGFQAGQPYAGPLGQFLAEPVKVADVLNALRRFNGDCSPARGSTDPA